MGLRQKIRELLGTALVLPIVNMESALTTSEPPRAGEKPQGALVRFRPAQKGDIDGETLAAAQSGNAQAIERFVRHYQGPVFAFLSRCAGRGPHVEDLAQEVFLRTLRALPQFVKSEAKISTWIFQIAVRLLQDRRKRPTHVLVSIPETLSDTRDNPEETCAHRRSLRQIETLAEQLPEEQRLVLVLIEFHGASHEEVAEVMHSNIATVKTRLHRARRFLREGIAKEHGENS